MALSLQCPNCGKTLRAGDGLAGRTASCPNCKMRIDIPIPAAQPIAGGAVCPQPGTNAEGHVAPANPKLTSCPDCDGVVSRLAHSCPHCGRPLTSETTPDRLVADQVIAFGGSSLPVSDRTMSVKTPGLTQATVESSPPPSPDAGIPTVADVESSESHVIHQRGFQPGDHVAVVLPYALSNIVFIQALPFWCSIFVYLILMLDVLLGGKLFHDDMLRDPSTFLRVIGHLAFVSVFTFCILCIFRWALWRPAMSGRKVAVCFLYILYLPIVAYALAIILLFLLGIGFSVSFSTPVHGWKDTLGWVVAATIAAWLGISLLCLILNFYEKGLSDFVKLNGYCPACRHWRFGYIRRPTAVTCSHCGVIIDFIRAEEEGKS